MIRDSDDRLADLFDRASAMSRDDAGAFLARECFDNEQLRNEILSLLEHDRLAPDDFLKPIRDPVADEDAACLVGSTVGRCRIEKIIGSGGMGTVYLAEQDSPRRYVALKVMNNATSREAARRFEFESSALGRLRHTNIAHVYEAGIHRDASFGKRDLPYFIMEYVPSASPITTYCDGHGLSIRDRLELFAVVCDAVHHGHQMGVIHRDLKPGNILVGDDGAPKVIDFGVARSTDSDVAVTTMRTDVGQLVGTLQYMSPEQCDADPAAIDTRSDVYSLGVVLYELLTGKPPYDARGSSIYTATRIIRESEPVRPSSLNRALRGDIEAMLLKALEKDKEKRYASAADLAQDIRRHLDGQPIEARPPTPSVKLVRWMFRHPVVATAISCLIVGICGLTAAFGAIWYVAYRPDRIERLLGDRRLEPHQTDCADEARLLSSAGRELHAWGGPASSVADAHLVERPAALGGGTLAIIGYNSTDTRFPDPLCAYDIDGSYDLPTWSRRIETKDLPVDLVSRGIAGDKFSCRFVSIANVFPDPAHPGSEIIAVFSHGLSHRAICIFDLNGRPLYRVWHDGAVSALYWMNQRRLLILAGDNALRNWDRNGKLLHAENNPLVVFSVRPLTGYIGTNWLPFEPGEGPGSPVWYKGIWVGDTAVRLGDGPFAEIFHPLRNEPARSAMVSIQFGSGANFSNTVSWEIDEFGDFLPGSRQPSDNYQIDQASSHPTLPDPELFHLGDLPPIQFNADGSPRKPGQRGQEP